MADFTMLTKAQMDCVAFARDLANTIATELTRPVTPKYEGEIKHSIARAQSIAALLTEALT